MEWKLLCLFCNPVNKKHVRPLHSRTNQRRPDRAELTHLFKSSYILSVGGLIHSLVYFMDFIFDFQTIVL